MNKAHSRAEREASSLTPEEMKAIGEIELGPSRHERFLNHHYKKLIVLTLVVMLVAVVAIVYGTYRTKQEKDAASELIAAVRVFPSSDSVSEGFDLATLERSTKDYADTQAAGSAKLLRGIQLLAGGQEKEGKEALRDIVNTAPDPSFRLRAQVYLASYTMHAGQNEEATEQWQAVSRSGQSPYLALSLLSLGDLENEAGKQDIARSYYERLMQDCPASPLVFTARQRLLLLGVDAPHSVEPEKKENSTPDADNLPQWEPMQLPGGATN